MSLIKEGKIEDGLASMAKAIEANPDNAEYRKEYIRLREQVVGQRLKAADKAKQSGDLDAAESSYREVLAINPAESRARIGLDSVQLDRRHAIYLADAETAFRSGDIESALEHVRSILAENPDNLAALKLRQEVSQSQGKGGLVLPTLQQVYSRPINLEFRDANVKMVYESLSRTTGINFLFDKDVRPDLRTTVYLRNASIDEALELIAQTSQLQRKILNSNTVLVYPNTTEKLKEYQDLVVRGFYLKNTDAKTMQDNLKLLFKGRDMIIDEKLNLIVMRDTPEAVRLVERVIAMHDIPEPEVMLEVEVLEVQRSRLNAIGIQWPSQMALTPLRSGGGAGLTVDDLRSLSGSTIGVGVGNTLVNLRRDVTDVDILANPRVRVRNKEKAKIMIGDRLPVVTTTTTATGLVSDNIQYLDVGLKLDVEPEVRMKNDVLIKLALEVSSVTSQVTTPSGSLAYQVGTRNANTSLLLRDGETQILAGLISTQERSAGKRVPGLGDVPVIGRLFGSSQDENSKTEIVLSITPRVIRGLKRPDMNQTEFWSGTESNLRSKPMSFQARDVGKSQAGSSAQAAPQSQVDSESPAGSILSNAIQPEVAARSVQLSWQGPAKVGAGEEFKVALRVKADGSIRSLPIQFAYDPKVLQVIDATEGGFFSQNNGATSFSRNIDAASGKAFVSITRSDVNGAKGEGIALHLSMRALAPLDASVLKVLQATAIAQSDVQPSVALPPPWGPTAGQ